MSLLKKTEKICANVEPKQINVSFHPITQKEDTIQYVPIDSTLKAVLSHEDVITHIYTENTSKKGVFKTLKYGSVHKKVNFLTLISKFVSIMMISALSIHLAT